MGSIGLVAPAKTDHAWSTGRSPFRALDLLGKAPATAMPQQALWCDSGQTKGESSPSLPARADLLPRALAVFGFVAALGCAPADESRGTPNAAISLADLGLRHVFVIPMENRDASEIYGNPDAPYINDSLVPAYARAIHFDDELPHPVPSEPHYVWMEAGTNAFSDHTFTTDDDPSETNSTDDTHHLIAQIRNADSGITWRSYQEGLDDATGACPVASSGFYRPKHNPFVFFRDVAGNPPSKDEPYCAAHHRSYTELASDLASSDMADFVFITPDQCHDMHGQTGCPTANAVRAGDDWLRAELPPLIAWANDHAGVIFLVWDEGNQSGELPFFAIGPTVKPHYAGSVAYTHSALLKSIETIFGLPVLPTVAASVDLADLFEAPR